MEAHQQARWTPTPEQIGMLKDIYYNSGIRSPTPEQIQKIIARLRQYGRIEVMNDCSISSGSDHVETLPLFPMHGGEDNFSTTYCNNKPEQSSYYSGSNGSNDGHGSSRPSLELSLNSYTSWSSGLM
ncbi:hypothetical protein LWI29_026000 [Acer saccharum]|uniref:Homeobox domain-containing protein n=1 Tax=Acer saccharum TaxID=4024 RepID=A0AA39SV07_ACESA|nr:hypothetical protein LWI29_026000 [Acer saccharum]